jgi:hypothetical protein
MATSQNIWMEAYRRRRRRERSKTLSKPRKIAKNNYVAQIRKKRLTLTPARHRIQQFQLRIATSPICSQEEYTKYVGSGRVKDQEIYNTDVEFGQSRIDNVEWLSPRLVGPNNLSLGVYPSSLETVDPSPPNLYSGFSSDAILDLSLSPSISIPPSLNKNIEFESASLLMHYVDHVLYIQFPFYNDALSHHGRAWLLSLITTVKPICRSI